MPEEFEIRGIFDVGYGQYNASFIISSLANAQQAYEFSKDAVHGLQVMLRDPFQVEAVRKELRGVLGPQFQIRHLDGRQSANS